MFSIHATAEEFETENASNVFWLRKTGSGKSRDYRAVIVFEKSRSKCFPSKQKRKAGVSKFPQFEGASGELRFVTD